MGEITELIYRTIWESPLHLQAVYLAGTLFLLVQVVCTPSLNTGEHFPHLHQFYIALFAVAPTPRDSLRSETQFRAIEESGEISDAKPLPCWQDKYNAQKLALQRKGESYETNVEIEKATLFMSLVVPAFNEEERLETMLTEAVEYLRQEYGASKSATPVNGSMKKRKTSEKGIAQGVEDTSPSVPTGWEIIVVSDGSKDKTVETALRFARKLGKYDCTSIRVVSLMENRGKGGAVTHGMKYVRGKYAIFADADGASKFEDLGQLVTACKKIEDTDGRGLAIGSRAHLVGSEAVVKVRNPDHATKTNP